MASVGNATTPSLHSGMDYRVRATFYALTPEETYVQHLKDVPDILLDTVPIMLLITLVEVIVLRVRGEADKFRLHSAVINYATGVVNEAGRVFIFRGVEFSAYLWVYNNLRLFPLPWNSFLTYVVALLGVDFCTYWWHRLCHEMSFMWAAHYVHHSSEEFNSAVGARISITMRPFKWVYYLPLAILGLPPPVYLVHSQLGLVWAFWVHNEAWPKTQKIIPVLGHVIEFVMSTPSHHRVHHGANKYCIDKNYGGTLIIWDRLFGTFAEEREDEEISYGTIANKDNNHIIGLQADPWRELWGRICAAKTTKDKLKTIVYGPGWTGQHRLGNIDDIPDVRGRKKHQFPAPTLLNLYLAVHCFFVLVGYIEAGAKVREINAWVGVLHLCYIVLAYCSLGWLYSAHQDNSHFWLEPIRLLVSLATCQVLPMFASPLYISCVTGINFLSFLVWPIIKSQALSMTAKKTT